MRTHWALALALAACGSDGASGGAVPADGARDAAAGADAAPADAASAGDLCRPPYFPPGAPWNQPIDDARPDDESDAVIGHLSETGFGLGRMQIDFSLDVLCAGADAPLRDFTPTDDFFADECDRGPVPVPPGGNVEGEAGYACAGDGDCHLLVVQGRRLFEQWRVDIGTDAYRGGCLAVWDLSRVYPDHERGEQCTSADAAGLPITPLLFDADEVAAGEIRHAIRFVLPNDRIRHVTYVRPAAHATRAAGGGADSPPYGARLRLRPDFPLDSLPNDGARTVARALQHYGMILADGGSVALTARSDRHTRAKWDGLLDSHDLAAITPADFTMVDGGPRYTWDGDCRLDP